MSQAVIFLCSARMHGRSCTPLSDFDGRVVSKRGQEALSGKRRQGTLFTRISSCRAWAEEGGREFAVEIKDSQRIKLVCQSTIAGV